MFGSFSPSHYASCPECGAAVPKAEMDEHVCEPERWLDFQMFQRREEIAHLESEVGAYLASPEGQFELWYAERNRGSDTAGRQA